MLSTALPLSPTLPSWVPSFFTAAYAHADMVWPRALQDERAAAVAARLQLRPHDVVLDQCCGTGGLSLGLARLGFVPLGVDQSADYIEQARLAADREGLHASFEVADAGTWHPPMELQGAVSWHTSLGYGGEAGARVLLQALRSGLAPARRWLIEVRHAEAYRRALPPVHALEVPAQDGHPATLTRRSRWEGQQLHQDWELRRGHRVLWSQENTVCWHPTLPQWLGLIEAFGDRVVGVTADAAGAAVDADSPRLVIVAERAP